MTKQFNLTKKKREKKNEEHERAHEYFKNQIPPENRKKEKKFVSVASYGFFSVSFLFYTLNKNVKLVSWLPVLIINK